MIFFGKLKTITDELAITGNPISSLDFITHLISRLGQLYYLVVVYIEANLLKMTINEGYFMLLTLVARLEASQLSASEETKLNCAANIAQTGPNFKIRGHIILIGKTMLGIIMEVEVVIVMVEVFNHRTNREEIGVVLGMVFNLEIT